MTRYFRSKKECVAFVVDHLKSSISDLPSITIIEPEKSGECYVTFATIKSSDVPPILKSLREPIST
jgi:hypothetical protein